MDSPPSEPSQENKPKFRAETTGNYWQDVREAVKRISLWDDLQRIGEIPCARSSLLNGIASGVGIGVIRGMSARPFVACNWAVGTFTVITLGTWTMCQKARMDERRRVQQVVEQIPKRFVKPNADSESTETLES